MQRIPREDELGVRPGTRAGQRHEARARFPAERRSPVHGIAARRRRMQREVEDVDPGRRQFPHVLLAALGECPADVAAVADDERPQHWASIATGSVTERHTPGASARFFSEQVPP